MNNVVNIGMRQFTHRTDFGDDSKCEGAMNDRYSYIEANAAGIFVRQTREGLGAARKVGTVVSPVRGVRGIVVRRFRDYRVKAQLIKRTGSGLVGWGGTQPPDDVFWPMS